MFVQKIPMDQVALVTCIQCRSACAIDVLFVAVLASGHVLADASIIQYTVYYTVYPSNKLYKPPFYAILFIFILLYCLLSTAIAKSHGYTFLSSLDAHSLLRCFFWPRSKQQARWMRWTKVHPWVPWQIMSIQLFDDAGWKHVEMIQ